MQVDHRWTYTILYSFKGDNGNLLRGNGHATSV
jgi:hypothetical protein